MRFDYDLVIIGGTIAARQAALTAVSWNARVALVEPSQSDVGNEIGIQSTLGYLGQIMQRLQQAESLGIHWGRESHPIVNWADALYWAQQVVENLEAERSPDILAAHGVDVIVGNGEFCRRPRMAFVVNGRVLRSRRYLIATAARQTMLAIEGLVQANPLTLEQLWRSPQGDGLASLSALKPNSHLILIGASPVGVELAQTLNRCGFQVTLITSRDRLLPQEDVDAVRLIQAQLEAEGVQVLTQAEVTQVRQLGQQKWVQAGTRALEADEIILTTGQQPDLETLNLAAVDVAVSDMGIQVNPKLQTTHPRIYACGEVLGDYPFAHIAHYEADIAVKNALFFPRFQVDYSSIPWAIATDPALARIGLTEAQARHRYGDRMTVLYQPLKRVAKAQMQGNTTGFCKLIVRPNGQILGVHIVSPEAEELIAAIAPLMRHKHPLQTLASFPAISPSWSEVLHLAALEWRQHQSDRHPLMREVRETWFNWRRS
ncbi:MAG: NAD(P)/FAD-dependent oxidoreductase [Oculatellaceae cyanobacterium bins.114]|nr:NAD(P)/FAD-dependent oxidoreductase [Oculatellaceae cyanobacterium bins.114]